MLEFLATVLAGAIGGLVTGLILRTLPSPKVTAEDLDDDAEMLRASVKELPDVTDDDLSDQEVKRRRQTQPKGFFS